MKFKIHRLVSNSSWQILFSFLRAALGFYVTSVVAKNLNPDVFGSLQFILGVYYLLIGLELICHSSIVKKYLLSNKFSHSDVMGTSLFLSGSIMLLTFVLCIPVAYYLYLVEGDLFWTFLIVQVSLLPRCLNCLFYYLDSILESKKSSASHFVGALSSGLFRLFSIFKSQNLIYQGMGFAMQSLVATFVCFLFYLKKIKFFKWSFNKVLLKAILRESFPLFLASLASMALFRFDIIMLEWLSSSSSVGFYSVASKLSEPWLFVGGALINSFFPSLVTQNLSKESYQNKLVFFNSLVLMVSLGICGFVFFTGEFFLKFFFSQKYLNSVPILLVHIWSLPFLFLLYAQHLWEVKNGYLKFAVYKNLFAALINIVLNYFFIPKWGGLAAAYTTVFTYFMAGVGFNIFWKESRHYMVLQLKSLLFYKVFLR